MNTEKTADGAKANDLTTQLKAQRLYNSANTLATLADNVHETMRNDNDKKVVGEELDKIHTEIVKLQDRLIQATMS